MSGEAFGNDSEAKPLDDVIEEWLRDGYFDGVFVKFRREFQNLGDVDIERAIATVIDKMRDHPTASAFRHPRGYLIVATRNRLRNALRRLIPDELPDDDGEHALGSKPTEDERLFAAELLEVVRARIARWPNKTMGAVTLYWGSRAPAHDREKGHGDRRHEAQDHASDAHRDGMTRPLLHTSLGRLEPRNRLSALVVGVTGP